jgi:hypothetical protein
MDAEQGESLPRLVVARGFSDVKAVTAMLSAGMSVFLLIRTSDEDRQRLLDFLAGWALGSKGELDRIGPNTVVARSADAAPVHLGRAGLVSAVEEILATDVSPPMTRVEEERLVPLAVAGSVEARRRIVDAYAELATLLALGVRTRSVTEAQAVRIAHEELDRLVTFPSKGPLLASLVEGIVKRLAR